MANVWSLQDLGYGFSQLAFDLLFSIRPIAGGRAVQCCRLRCLVSQQAWEKWRWSHRLHYEHYQQYLQ